MSENLKIFILILLSLSIHVIIFPNYKNYSEKVSKLNFIYKNYLNTYNKIIIKEKELSNIKLHVKKDFLNFFERRKSEDIIQYKNKLIKELNFLYKKLDEIIKNIILERSDLILNVNIETIILDNNLFEILDSFDDIYYKYIITKFTNNNLTNDMHLLDEFIIYLQKKLILLKKSNYKYDFNKLQNQIENLKKLKIQNN